MLTSPVWIRRLPVYRESSVMHLTPRRHTSDDSDAFVAKLNPNAPQGQQLLWSTYVGGTGTDSGTGVAVDTGAANVYLVGTTNSADIGTSAVTLNTSAAYQAVPGPACDCGPAGTLVLRPRTFSERRLCSAPDATATTTHSSTIPVNVTLNYFSYLGGGGNEAGLAIAVDSAARARGDGVDPVNAGTPFPGFPGSNPIQSALTGSRMRLWRGWIRRRSVGRRRFMGTYSWASYFGGRRY